VYKEVWGHIPRRSHANRPWGALIAPPKEARLGSWHLGCSRTLADLPGHRLCQVGWWLGLAPSPVVWCLDLQGMWAFSFIPLRKSALCFSGLRILMYFSTYLCISHAKHHSSKYMWNFVNSNDICV
jgi:hypothetical protein